MADIQLHTPAFGRLLQLWGGQSCFDVVNVRTGKFERTMCKVFNAETFQDCRKKLSRYRSRGKRVVVVLNNARYHHAVSLAPFPRNTAAY
jgi:hypothetical protein